MPTGLPRQLTGDRPSYLYFMDGEPPLAGPFSLLGGDSSNRQNFPLPVPLHMRRDAITAGRQDPLSTARCAALVDCRASSECEHIAWPARGTHRRLAAGHRSSACRRRASAGFRSRRRGDTGFRAPRQRGQTRASYRVVARSEAVGIPSASRTAERPVAGHRAADLDVTGCGDRGSGDSRHPPSPPPHAHRMPPRGRSGCPNKKAAPHPLARGGRGCRIRL